MAEVNPNRPHVFSRLELPTWILLLTNYFSWGLITWNHAAIPWWVMLFVGGFTVCLHGSLQHEFLHGHPTRHPVLNKILVWPPIGLWMPYPIYRDSHIAHHRCERLTDPFDDSESFYVAAVVWQRLPKTARLILKINNTLSGRLVIGPVIAVSRFWVSQAQRLLAGDNHYARVWAWHLAGCAMVLFWVMAICEFPFWQYALLVAWPGLSLTLLRSYTEHRPAENLHQRTIIIEGSWLTRLLFLNNNYHYVHHQNPGMAWYRLGYRYRKTREQVLGENGGFFYRSYFQLFRRFAFRPKDLPVYPVVA